MLHMPSGEQLFDALAVCATAPQHRVKSATHEAPQRCEHATLGAPSSPPTLEQSARKISARAHTRRCALCAPRSDCTLGDCARGTAEPPAAAAVAAVTAAAAATASTTHCDARAAARLAMSQARSSREGARSGFARGGRGRAPSLPSAPDWSATGAPAPTEVAPLGGRLAVTATSTPSTGDAQDAQMIRMVVSLSIIVGRFFE